MGGALVRDCEAELMELLRQTDALMRAREATLHADVRDAQAQAKLKQQEAQVKAALLDRTNKEVELRRVTFTVCSFAPSDAWPRARL